MKTILERMENEYGKDLTCYLDHDDAWHGDGLPQLHHAGVDKTDHHHARRGRGLDHRGDPRTKQNALERIAGKTVKDHTRTVKYRFITSPCQISCPTGWAAPA